MSIYQKRILIFYQTDLLLVACENVNLLLRTGFHFVRANIMQKTYEEYRYNSHVSSYCSQVAHFCCLVIALILAL